LFLFHKLKKERKDYILKTRMFKKDWDGVAGTGAAEECATTFMKWIVLCNKCFQNGGKNVKKSLKINILITLIFSDLFTPTHLI